MDIEEESKKVIVKLTDFGLSKVETQGKQLQGKAGTIMAMSPEIISKSTYDTKADCWALGVVLFELLTDRIPFYHDDVQVLMKLITDCEINYADLQENTKLSSESIDLLKKLL